MSTRRTIPGGWVKRQKQSCRWCGGEVPKGRWTFCSAACVHEWKLRSDPGHLREQVFARDRGVCAICGLDTEAMRKDKRKLDYDARRRFEKEWGGRRHLWDADHIVPVAEGGGECDLSNMRTLCLRCHHQATAALRKRLAKKQDSPHPGAAEQTEVARRNHLRKGSGTSRGTVDAASPTEEIMPGKKAHKPRNVENAGLHGVNKQAAPGRKSTGQTEGQFARDMKGRKGQFGGAGDSPLIKK